MSALTTDTPDPDGLACAGWKALAYSAACVPVMLQVTPASYLELLTTFIKLLAEKRKDIGVSRQRLEAGLSKLLTTASQVEVMQACHPHLHFSDTVTPAHMGALPTALNSLLSSPSSSCANQCLAKPLRDMRLLRSSSGHQVQQTVNTSTISYGHQPTVASQLS